MKEAEVLKERERLDEELRKEYNYEIYAKLERKIMLMKGNKKDIAEEMDKEKFKKLIYEYKKFKMENVRHFRFNPNPSLSAFGKFFFSCPSL